MKILNQLLKYLLFPILILAALFSGRQKKAERIIAQEKTEKEFKENDEKITDARERADAAHREWEEFSKRHEDGDSGSGL